MSHRIHFKVTNCFISELETNINYESLELQSVHASSNIRCWSVKTGIEKALWLFYKLGIMI